MEYRVITWEQQRSAAHDLNRETLLALEDQSENNLDSHLKKRVQQLLSTRQIILDRLIQEGGRYSNQLVEYRRLSDSFLERLHEVEHFLFAHVLWYRSVPRPIIPRLGDLAGGAGWFLSPERLNSASIVGYVFRGDGLFAALFLIAVVLLRQRMMRRLKDIGEHISVPGRDGFRFTLEAVMITFLLAAPLPIFFAIAGTIVGRIGDSTYFFSLAAALSKLVIVAFLFELIRQIFADRGLAEAHFGWPAHATQPLHRGLLISEGIGLPLLLIALHLGFAGFRLDSPDQLQVFSNSLGRVAFIAALVIFGVSILTMLKPEKTLSPSDQEMRVPWPRRFSEYAFPTAFLGAYPIVILATIVPALFAIFGFYVTALLLAYQMLRTLLLGVFVLIGGGLFHRWRIVNRNRSLLDEDGLAKEDGPSAEFLASEKQIRQLFRFAVIAALSVGLFGIWNDALPWLQVLKRVQILPRIELLETVEDGEGLAGTTATLSGEKPVASETPEKAGKVEGLPVPGSGSGEVSATVSPPDSPLTVWEILEAMLAAVATLLLVKNLPGVIEIVLMRRTTLDGGARFAFSTLVRYSITIVGAIAVFSLLGVTWGKVQWLAAALTFGLGFGLQEIVANFVSGLILLVERPVRVGDVVTIGTLMGRVSRIQIRATTIILWDRSEMIVPNKEFITTKLVNWTLSDSKRRIEIPLRVEYGTDLDVVRTTLVEIAQRHPAVLADPAPHVLLLAFGDDAINFELRFVVDFGKGLSTKDEVQMAIDQAFREKGINFALPRSEIRLITSSSDDRDGTQS
jgi:potassium efflux system protein